MNRAENIVIAGCGSYLPSKRVHNSEIELASGYCTKSKGCSLDDWAFTHHGGRFRHWAAVGEATSDLAIRASVNALEDARISATELDLIVVATFTSDHRVPSTAARVQAGLGSKAKFLQIDAACTGFIDAMWVASNLMRQQKLQRVLVVAADILSRLSRPNDYLTQSVFGDAAGAVVLTWRNDPTMGMFDFSTGSDGNLADYVLAAGGGSRLPLTAENMAEGAHFWQLKFHDIKLWALERMTLCAKDVIERTGLVISDVSWLVPHQASTKMIQEVASRLGIPDEKVVMTYEETGNTSGASIPLALDIAKRSGKFREGDWVVMAAVGAGMAWGALSYRW